MSWQWALLVLHEQKQTSYYNGTSKHSGKDQYWHYRQNGSSVSSINGVTDSIILEFDFSIHFKH